MWGGCCATVPINDNNDKNNSDIKLKEMKELENNVPKNFVKLCSVDK